MRSAAVQRQYACVAMRASRLSAPAGFGVVAERQLLAQPRKMRLLPCLFLLSVSTVATASIPTGKNHGPWLVTSISSVDGVHGGDASVILAQGDEHNDLEVRWNEGSASVNVSMYIDECVGEESFDASYSVATDEWLQMSDKEVRTRLRANILIWLDQIRRTCASTPAFKLRALDAAAKDFTDRLRGFAGYSE